MGLPLLDKNLDLLRGPEDDVACMTGLLVHECMEAVASASPR